MTISIVPERSELSTACHDMGDLMGLSDTLMHYHPDNEADGALRGRDVDLIPLKNPTIPFTDRAISHFYPGDFDQIGEFMTTS